MATDPSGAYGAFAHLTADKHELYRAVLRVFADAKGRFVLHLRPDDVLARLDRGIDRAEVEAALRQLVAWGNLSADPDTTEVVTVEEFYRARFLYRLTSVGEAAERALVVFEDGLRRSGELQTSALADIRDLLHDLREHARVDAPDPAKVHLALRGLRDRFDELTDRAQTFVASLQRTIDLHGIDVDALLAYKDALLGYLERFIGELVVAQANIAALLRELQALDVGRLLDLAADREVADTLAPDDAEVAAARAVWTARWDGLTSWFLPDAIRQSQAEVLRSRARAAIPALLRAIGEVNERRLSRSDRGADLRALARWFAECDTDADAHRLWRAAFCLAPARHLTLDQDTLEDRDQQPVAPNTSWLDAPPIVISPRLRRTGRTVRRGRVSDVIDRSQEKQLLARLAIQEAAQVAAARARLCTDGPIRLSQLGWLDPVEFELFLDLLGAALAAADGRVPVTATTSDGQLEVVLVPADDGALATLRTHDGELTGPDHHVTIRVSFHAGVAS